MLHPPPRYYCIGPVSIRQVIGVSLPMLHSRVFQLQTSQSSAQVPDPQASTQQPSSGAGWLLG